TGLFFCLLSGCSAQRPAAETAAAYSEPAAESPVDEEESSTSEPQSFSSDEKLAELGEKPPMVPAPSSSCPRGEIPARHSCEDAELKLSEALALSESPEDRDSALAELEECQEYPLPWLRALRAELGDGTCADVLVEPLFASEEKLTREQHERLLALGWAAWLRRLAVDPPPPPSGRTKAELLAYFQSTLFPWIKEQSLGIQEIATWGSELKGYPKGVVAIEAGMADMRFVEIARRVPIPEEFSGVQEAVDLYYSELDLALEARKARGRDAALVGLGSYLGEGVLKDRRLDEARGLLSRVFGGGRINALDEILFPEPRQLEPETPRERIAAEIPTPYLGVAIDYPAPEPRLVRFSLSRGYPRFFAQAVNQATESGDLRALDAYASFLLGRTYYQGRYFLRAEALLTELLDSSEKENGSGGSSQGAAFEPAELRFLRALSTALMAGPATPVQLIAQGPIYADAAANFAILAAFESSSPLLKGQARFDSAYLREISAPPADALWWQQAAKEYEEAAQLLNGEQAAVARERAKAAAEIGRVIQEESPQASP
ncbi:MAG: hypothetical protein MK135_16775, partial [Polyangiaceae bacterium]|nr:hypothetical protein [Polyangiaceae bacterium]